MFSYIKRVHFVGIGGIGMSGIAEVLINRGFEVSGSDLQESENTRYLEKLGAKIFIGHAAENIEGAEVVTYSSAVTIDKNPETLEAISRKIPIIRRAEMLTEVSRLNYCLAIAGTHGKTTTTSMLSLILLRAGFDPTVIVGGRLKDLGGTNARLGNGEWTVVEADEYDRSFLQLLPAVAVLTNIETDHLDVYGSFSDLKDAFQQFANKVPFYGFVCAGIDCKSIREILPQINKKIVTFALTRKEADYYANNIRYKNFSSTCNVYERGKLLGEITINVPGEYNVKNALAAIAVARQFGIDFKTIQEVILDFHGVFRRFEIKGNKNGAIIVDDYAHHPTEVNATLKGARNYANKRIIAIFQPHTYTRTADLYKEFAESFKYADIVFVTDVYPARELPIPGVTGELIVEEACKRGYENIYYVEKKEDIPEKISKIIESDDIIITIGAGDIWKIADKILEN